MQEPSKFPLKRYDLSEDKSLRAWSTADEYLLKAYSELKEKPENLALYNDRFGYLSCHLNTQQPIVVVHQKSQELAIEKNLASNKIAAIKFHYPLDSLKNKIDFALIKVPKSLALFYLFLHHIAENSSKELELTCAFMTRHFSPKMLEVAGTFFEVVEQSRAVKKSRLLLLKNKKENPPKEILQQLTYREEKYQQYRGVFSSKHIDYATQYLIENIEINKSAESILDLGSGNGVIAHQIRKENKAAELHLLDDSFLAIASGKLNLNSEKVFHHYGNDLAKFEDGQFDVIVTNPPFHFEYEINIQVPLELFRQCFRCLQKGGTLQLVANQHLNYKVHLLPIFESVEILAENKKFVIYKCTK